MRAITKTKTFSISFILVPYAKALPYRGPFFHVKTDQFGFGKNLVPRPSLIEDHFFMSKLTSLVLEKILFNALTGTKTKQRFSGYLSTKCLVEEVV
jgi:hypothetical protein